MPAAKAGVNWLAAVALAGALFALALVLLGNPALAAVLAGAGGLGGALLFPVRRPPLELPAGLDPAQVERDLANAEAAIAEIKSLCARMAKPTAQKDARRVHDLMRRIVDDLRRDPADIRRARSFLAYHADATRNVFRRYVELSLQDVRDPSLLESLARTERSFGTMARAFERLLAGLLENDVMDLDVEIKTLEGAFRAEGVDIGSDGGKA